MKAVRIILSMLVACLVLSAWTPATANAKAGDDQSFVISGLNGSNEGAKVAYVTVDNRTGGSLSIQLQALPFDPRHSKPDIQQKSYWFLATKQGKIQYQILAGRYTYTIRSSNCGGKRINTKVFTGVTFLGIYTCDK
jgi:hypothetical protein